MGVYCDFYSLKGAHKLDFKDLRCPVCGVPFDDGDDIVVCPECGTPHHRICYERIGKCANEQHHNDSYSFNNNEEASFSICPSCGAKNPKSAIFCSSCSRPMTDNADDFDNRQSQNNQQPFGGAQQQGMPPFGFPGFNPGNMYQAVGMNPEEEIADGVKAQDCEKYVKNNAFYYLPVFRNIKKFGRSRFNFSAALFNGGWFLYRKMYLYGAIFTALMAAAFFAEAFFSNIFITTYEGLIKSMGSRANIFTILDYAYKNLSASEFWMFLITPIASFMRIVIMAVSGIIGNRLYYRQCSKKIPEIKSKHPSNSAEALEKQGGTNNIAAIVLLVCYIAYNIISMLLYR